MKFAVLDFETTGMSPGQDEIIQAGLAIVDEAGAVCSTFSSLVRPEKSIPEEITRLTGIRNEDVQEAPSIEDLLPQLIVHLEDAILVGHQVGFDAGFLQAELDKAGYLPFTGRMIDTVALARLAFPTMASYQLNALTTALGVAHERPHQADSDALATAEILTASLSKLRSLPLLTLQRVSALFDSEASDLGWLLHQIVHQAELHGQMSNAGDDAPQVHVYRQFAMRVGEWNEDDSAIRQKHAAEAAEALADKPFDSFASEVRERLKQLLPAYEAREGQDMMFEEVLQSLDEEAHLMVEAGTGTGKSLGYLLPSLYYGLRESKKIVVSTHTIQLQEQLRQRDLPLLQQVFPVKFRAAVFKGRSNYLCLRKFENLVTNPGAWPGEEEAVARGAMIVWLAETLTGEGEELNLGREREQWDVVASDAASCLNRACPWFHRCFYHRARNEASKADLVITNHALVFTDMQAEHRLLPAYDQLIVDEAHHLEETASHHLGRKTGYRSLAMPLQRLWKDARTGLVPQLLSALAAADHEEAPAWVETIEELSSRLIDIRDSWDRWTEALFAFVAGAAAADESGNLTLRLKPDSLPQGWQEIRVDADNAIMRISDFLRPMERIIAQIREETDEYALQGLLTDLSGILNQISSVQNDVKRFVELAEDGYVYWVEAHFQYRGRSVWMYAVPIDVSKLLREGMFDRKSSVVMTSATLTVNKSFQYVKELLGLDDPEESERVRTAQVPSPFRYREQALLLVPRDFPGIRGKDGEDAFVKALIASLADLARTAGGRMLVLFTSYRMLKAVYGPLQEALEPAGIQVLGQGVSGLSRSRLTKQFMDHPATVLLGTSSFWEGVDLPGDSLTLLAIVRLPFQPPNHPVIAAKSEKLESENKNPFMKLSLPQAVIRFKQGFGRLVRTTSDRGIVIVYDTRAIDTKYGRYFLNSLPGPKMEHLPTAGMPSRVRQWLAQGASGQTGDQVTEGDAG